MTRFRLYSITSSTWARIVCGDCYRARIEESEGTISLTAVFSSWRGGRHRPHHEREGLGAAYVRRFLGVGPPIGRVDSRNTVPADISLHHCSGRASTEATYMMVQLHWFREQRPIVRSMIGLVVIATVLCLFLGPIGILYALGFEVLYLLTYLLTTALAALLDPDVY
jgi:hypothetical protein